VVASDDEHTAQGQVLTDHQAELDDLSIVEMIAQLGEKRGVDVAKVERHFFGVSNGEGVAWLELALRFR
jgi:hypothetical protein